MMKEEGSQKSEYRSRGPEPQTPNSKPETEFTLTRAPA